MSSSGSLFSSDFTASSVTSSIELYPSSNELSSSNSLQMSKTDAKILRLLQNQYQEYFFEKISIRRNDNKINETFVFKDKIWVVGKEVSKGAQKRCYELFFVAREVSEPDELKCILKSNPYENERKDDLVKSREFVYLGFNIKSAKKTDEIVKKELNAISIVNASLRKRRIKIKSKMITESKKCLSVGYVMTMLSKSTIKNNQELMIAFNFLVNQIAYAHEKHLTHLDIKSGNIMYVDHEEEKIPVLIDWESGNTHVSGETMYFHNGFTYASLSPSRQYRMSTMGNINLQLSQVDDLHALGLYITREYAKVNQLEDLLHLISGFRPQFGSHISSAVDGQFFPIIQVLEHMYMNSLFDNFMAETLLQCLLLPYIDIYIAEREANKEGDFNENYLLEKTNLLNYIEKSIFFKNESPDLIPFFQVFTSTPFSNKIKSFIDLINHRFFLFEDAIKRFDSMNHLHPNFLHKKKDISNKNASISDNESTTWGGCGIDDGNIPRDITWDSSIDESTTWGGCGIDDRNILMDITWDSSIDED